MLKSSSLWLYSSNLGTFWLKIEQFWPFEEISIFSHGGHLGYRTVLTDTIFKGDHLRIISAKFGWDWLNSFRGEDFFSNGQNCSILSQKVPKFELYKHNDELFNIYYGIFYELWTFTDFDRLCKLEKRGDEIKKIFPSETTEPISTKLWFLVMAAILDIGRRWRTQF
jgi:hypothetical protein